MLYTPAWEYYVEFKTLECQNTFQTRQYLVFTSREHKFDIECTGIDFRDKPTANQTQLRDSNNRIILKRVLYEVCIYLKLETHLYAEWLEDQLYSEINQAIYKYMANRVPTIMYWMKVTVKKEPPKLEPEIQEAINITNEAIKVQKEIVEKISYINKLRNDYYSKYWTFIEKTLAYLQLK